MFGDTFSSFILFLACSMGVAWFAAIYTASIDDKQFTLCS